MTLSNFQIWPDFRKMTLSDLQIWPIVKIKPKKAIAAPYSSNSRAYYRSSDRIDYIKTFVFSTRDSEDLKKAASYPKSSYYFVERSWPIHQSQSVAKSIMEMNLFAGQVFMLKNFFLNPNAVGFSNFKSFNLNKLFIKIKNSSSEFNWRILMTLLKQKRNPRLSSDSVGVNIKI